MASGYRFWSTQWPLRGSRRSSQAAQRSCSPPCWPGLPHSFLVPATVIKHLLCTRQKKIILGNTLVSYQSLPSSPFFLPFISKSWLLTNCSMLHDNCSQTAASSRITRRLVKNAELPSAPIRSTESESSEVGPASEASPQRLQNQWQLLFYQEFVIWKVRLKKKQACKSWALFTNSYSPRIVCKYPREN